jgi:hypothetical protein
MCVFQVEVAEKCAFFGQKWLKNMRFLGRSGPKKGAFFGLKLLKTYVFYAEVAEKRVFVGRSG